MTGAAARQFSRSNRDPYFDPLKTAREKQTAISGYPLIAD